ncbi:hypothetical protein [Craterilacuibacter sp.]|uniref:hypothetical protein n=1 Tax=Craterilacuibacter sp. TaxID=2870909 RepID=UPI003F2F3D68
MTVLNKGTARRQAGMLTLALVLALLMVTGLIGVYVARTSWLELKLTAGSYRVKQAAEAAHAGLQYGLAYYLEGGADHDADGRVDVDAAGVLASGSLSGKRWQVQLCDAGFAGQPCSPATAALASLRIVATGFSDDGSAKRTVSQLVRTYPVLPVLPVAALMVRSTASASGGALVVVNNQGSLTIWSGSPLAAVPIPFTTRITNGSLPDQPGSSNAGAGADTRLADAALAALTDEGLLRSFFALGSQDMAALADVHIAGHQALPAGELGGKVIVLSALAGQPYTRLPLRLGTVSEPVILLVDGELELAAGSEVFGVVYARKLSGHDGARVQGALLLQELGRLDGTLLLEYDAAVLAVAQRIQLESVLASSWRDW